MSFLNAFPHSWDIRFAVRHLATRLGGSLARPKVRKAILKRAAWLIPGFVLVGLVVAAAPSEEPKKVESLGKARLEAAVKQYDETWAYYQQARIDSYQVYVWSRMIMDTRREMSAKGADRLTAIEEHLGRMKKLEALITKVRRLGFGRSYDVGSANYYRLEAEHWLELERVRK